MQTSIATVPTANASSYLRKLCQHWSHRFPVEFNDQHGTIQMPQATCTLDAAEALLAVKLESQEGAEVARLRQVVEEHLQRFGFREELVFSWNPARPEHAAGRAARSTPGRARPPAAVGRGTVTGQPAAPPVRCRLNSPSSRQS